MSGSMPDANETCPNESTLRALLSLRKDDSLGGSLRRHLTRCKSCQSRLDRLTSASHLKPGLTGSQARGLVDAETLLRIRHAVTASVATGRSQAGIAAEPISQKHACTTDAAVRLIETDAADPGPPIHTALDTPQRIGKYEILHILGSGGMGTVWLAFDSELNRKVAIKSIDRADRVLESRLRREGQAISRLDDEHVVRLYCVEQDSDQRPFLVMEYVDGDSLSDLLQRRKRLESAEAVRIVTAAARGTDAAHSANILHRDIKPSNILIGRDGRTRVADFGLASFLEPDERLTRSGTAPGTPAYMSPEQAAGKTLSRASDVYSLGCVLYEAVTGVPPFHGTTHQILRQIAETDPRTIRQLNETVPWDVETICGKAMSKEPEHRYATAQDMADDLDRFLRGDAICARPENTWQKTMRWFRRNPRIAGLSMTVAALLVGITGVSLWSRAAIGRVNRDLAIEKTDAQTARSAAEASAEMATTQRQIALSSLNELVFEVQTALKDRPGTIRLRKEILDRTLPRLQMAVDNKNRPQVDHSTIVAWRRIGELQLMLGLTDESKSSFEKSIQLAHESRKRNPTDRQVEIDLFAGLLSLASSFQTRRMNEECRECLTQARSVHDSLKASEASDKETLLLGVDLESLAGDSYYEESRTKAEQFYLTAIEASRNATLEPSIDDEIVFRRASLYGKLCRLQLQLGRIDEADGNCQEWQALLAELRMRHPDNLKYQLETAFAASRESQIRHQQDRFIEAVEVGLGARDMLSGIAKLDSEYSRVRMHLGIQEIRLALLYFSGGDFGKATSHASQAFELQSQLLSSDPKDHQAADLAGEAAQLMGSATLASGQTVTAADWFHRQAELLTPFCSHAGTRKRRDAARDTADALDRIVAMKLEEISEWGQQAVPSSAAQKEWMVRALAMRVASIAGDFEIAQSIACRLLESQPPESIQSEIRSLLIVSLAASVPAEELSAMNFASITALEASQLSSEIDGVVKLAAQGNMNPTRLVALLVRKQLLDDPVYSLTILYFPELQPLRRSGLLGAVSRK